MGKADRLEAKIKRLRQIEASYRSEMRRAELAMEESTGNPEKARQKYEKVRIRNSWKIEAASEKIRDLTRKRAELVT